ncbi:DNA-dependent RNA polymerase subunit epsilon [Domibacillus indicus]|uniref:DNA-dependent RNA polymerase subunit epsilon n=1 Tax=Domibacillus indicus TaxID=1437523 RepID=UPI0006180E88|nr:DNA-dependent RNA polymerase subunit epsilon [Domibacillus indicus]
MIYKVYYQEDRSEVPVREKTKTLYVEAETEREVRQALKSRPYNIEFVQKVNDNHLEYEKKSPNFNLEQL